VTSEKTKTKKIVINRQFGGFGLSEEAFEWLIKNKGWKVTIYNKKGNYADETAQIIDCHSGGNEKYSLILPKYDFTNSDGVRDNPDVLEVVEKLGTKKASGKHAELKIVEIPNDVEWDIEEYDGVEWISEKHRTWR